MITVLAAVLAINASTQNTPTQWVLQNERLKVVFDQSGPVLLRDLKNPLLVKLVDHGAALTVSGGRIDTAQLTLNSVDKKGTGLEYSYKSSTGVVRVRYRLEPNWKFLSKSVAYRPEGDGAVKVDAADPLNLTVVAPSRFKLESGVSSSTWFLKQTAKVPLRQELFVLVQNPYGSLRQDDDILRLSYRPEMEWRAAYGDFVTDPVCVGVADLTKRPMETSTIPEWKMGPHPTSRIGAGAVDEGEWKAVRECARAFLSYKPAKTAKVHIPWCENDYQIDVAKPEGAAEYKRIIDRAAELGCEYLLLTPANSDVSRVDQNTDFWSWEDVLWLGLGQKIRKGEWDPKKDEVPASVQAMIDYAKSKNVKLMAYVYPSLDWVQAPEASAWAKGKADVAVSADTGVRSFQDLLVDKILAFCRKTGVAGVSFDHWWIAHEGASSKYAQWYGCRRILERLRQEMPDIVIDGRQQYQYFGVWTWLAGSYPHPTSTDEQPESFKAIPDLHTDRVSAARQRYTAYWYAVNEGAPVELLPGFITHQSERSNEQGRFSRNPSRTRDWDLLGWRYSLLSTVATAPYAMVVNMIPARDEDEFKALSEEDKRWFRTWMEWPNKHLRHIRHTRPILGQPAVGRIDGTSMIDGDDGYVFLFNPNYRMLTAKFKLDASIGLEAGSKFVVKQVYPGGAALIGPKTGLYAKGDEVSLPLTGGTAVVLQIQPSAGLSPLTVLGLEGRAQLKDGTLSITEVDGEIGTRQKVGIVLPKGATAKGCKVNGKAVSYSQNGDLLIASVQFSGFAFGKAHSLTTYDPAFTGGTLTAEVFMPARIWTQQEARKKKWPVNYTEDDRRATWLNSDRMLLFIHIADPKDGWTIKARVDNVEVPVLKAYNSIYGNAPDRTFLGYYLDLTYLEREFRHSVQIELPTLAPGQFQGMFIENVEPATTREVFGKDDRKFKKRR